MISLQEIIENLEELVSIYGRNDSLGIIYPLKKEKYRSSATYIRSMFDYVKICSKARELDVDALDREVEELANLLDEES